MIHRARDVVEAVLAFEEEVELLKGDASGHVRIGTGPYPAQPLLTRSIAALAERHERIQVSVVAGTPKDLLQALLRRELDCVISDVSKYEQSSAAETLEIVELPNEPVVIVMSPDYPMPSGDIQFCDLAHHRWAMPTPSPISARELAPPFDTELAAGRFPFYRLETTSACLDLAKAGHALTIVPRSLAIEACRHGDLVTLGLPRNMRTNDGIHLVRNRSRSPATKLLIEQILTVAKQADELFDDPMLRRIMT